MLRISSLKWNKVKHFTINLIISDSGVELRDGDRANFSNLTRAGMGWKTKRFEVPSTEARSGREPRQEIILTPR